MKIKIIKKKNLSDFQSWPIWECEPSKFDWTYSDEEHCFVIEGSVTVIGPENTVEINSNIHNIFFILCPFYFLKKIILTKLTLMTINNYKKIVIFCNFITWIYL